MAAGDTLGTDIVAAIDGLSAASRSDSLLCWRAISGAIATDLGNGTVPTLSAAWLVASVSSSSSAVARTRYAVNTSGGDVTMTLPAAVAGNAGMGINFKKLSSANNVVISSASLIDGAATVSITAQWSSVTVYSTGSTWYID